MTSGGEAPGHDDGPPDEAEEPSPEDPNRFPSDGVPAPLDEAPDGMTPADTDETTRRVRETGGKG